MKPRVNKPIGMKTLDKKSKQKKSHALALANIKDRED
jgi:hypothetical protein